MDRRHLLIGFLGMVILLLASLALLPIIFPPTQPPLKTTMYATGAVPSGTYVLSNFSSETLTNTIEGNEGIKVFFMEGCGASKQLMRNIVELVEMNGTHIPIIFINVSSSEDLAVVEQYFAAHDSTFQGTPTTIYSYKGGVYTGLSFKGGLLVNKYNPYWFNEEVDLGEII